MVEKYDYLRENDWNDAARLFEENRVSNDSFLLSLNRWNFLRIENEPKNGRKFNKLSAISNIRHINIPQR